MQRQCHIQDNLMGRSKKEAKGKEKFVPDIVPMTRLNKLEVESTTIKMLKDAHIWNDVLITDNNTDRKALLAQIKGLPDTAQDQICEAVDQIMGSLKDDVTIFTQNTLVSLEEGCNRSEDDFLKSVFLEVQECVKGCFSMDEILKRLAKEFGQEEKDFKGMLNHFFDRKKGYASYLQLSTIVAAQRKAEKPQLNIVDTEQVKDDPVQSKTEEKEQVQSSDQVKDDSVQSRTEEKGQVQSSTQAEKQLKVVGTEQGKDDDVQSKTEEKGSVLISTQTEKQLKVVGTEQGKDDDVQSKTEEKQPNVDNVVDTEQVEDDAFETKTEEKEQSESLSQQVINSNRELLDGLTCRTDLIETIRGSHIATKEDMEDLRRGIASTLEKFGDELSKQVAAGLPSILTSFSDQISKKVIKTTSSQIERALKDFEATVKELIQSSSESRAEARAKEMFLAEAEARAAANAPNLKEKMALHILEDEYEECFAMAVAGNVDYDLLCWLLTKVGAKKLPELPLSTLTLRKLLFRLYPLLITQNVGVDTIVYFEWFKSLVQVVRSNPENDELFLQTVSTMHESLSLLFINVSCI